MITTVIENIDDKKAAEYLSHNMVNRNLSRNKVLQYANSMAKGDWQLNGEAIKFNEKRELIDGQHRLSAIIKSGISINTFVMRDLGNDVSIMDRGRTRSVTDSLLIEGMDRKIANNKCVALAKLHFNLQTADSSSSVSDYKIREFLQKNIETLMSVHELLHNKGNAGRKIVDNAVIGLALFYALNVELTNEEAEKFIKIAKTGFYETKKQSSAIVLRNDFIAENITARGGGQERAHAVFAAEKALYDFHHGYERKITYKNTNKPTYSNNIMFKED